MREGVCVCVRERERKRERETHDNTVLLFSNMYAL